MVPRFYEPRLPTLDPSIDRSFSTFVPCELSRKAFGFDCWSEFFLLRSLPLTLFKEFLVVYAGRDVPDAI